MSVADMARTGMQAARTQRLVLAGVVAAVVLVLATARKKRRR